MKCHRCGIDKLSKEFPPETVNEECQHAPLVCLQCLLSSASEICPEEGCNYQIMPERKAWFEAIWREHFTVFNAPIVTPALIGKVSILLLNGDSTVIDIEENMTVLKLMRKINREMGVEINEQKLIFKSKEIEKYKENYSIATLQDYEITSGCCIQLVKRLYDLPQSLDKVFFDLSWQYPSDVGMCKTVKRDYLDASCFLFNDEECLQVIDYVQKDDLKIKLMRKYNVIPKNWGVFHDGDRMDDIGRIGHHIIQVSVKEIPSEINRMFFTLSAWNAPTISKYPNPTLKFYDSSNPDVSLCDTTFTHAGDSQAVIMCSLSRSASGAWAVYQNGQTSKGNSSDPEPLKTTIQRLIREGY